MGLFHKLRILAGALVHKPFMPRPEKVDLDEGTVASMEEGSAHGHLEPATKDLDVTDGERVADLLAKKQREEAG